MAWVPIQQSSKPFTFSPDNGGNPSGSTSMTDSVVTAANGGRNWTIDAVNGDLSEAIQFRVTVQSYSTDADSETDAASFQWDESGPQSQFNQNTNPSSAFDPDVIEANVAAGEALYYYQSGVTAPGPTTDANETFSMLVEVWEEAATTSYNCSCDDEYPTKTLAQMREFLMIRLGFGAMVATPLPGMALTLNSFLIDAQEQIYRQYKVFRLERFFTWDMEAGVRFYDLAENADECTKKLDPRMLTWVGISQDDNFWRPLVCGIKPEFYYGDITSWPTHYEIRQCIEVWPAPSDDTWKLRIKGYFGLLPFAADNDVNTVDYEAIQLYALANAKAHYGQPDAANYMSQFQTYVGKVTAGSHHTRRYIPGGDQYIPPPLPVLTGYPGDP